MSGVMARGTKAFGELNPVYFARNKKQVYLSPNVYIVRETNSFFVVVLVLY